MIYVDADRCTGCGACADACPTGALSMVDGLAVIDLGVCSECEACLDACLERAILSVSEPDALPAGAVVALGLSPPRSLATRLPHKLLPWMGTAMGFLSREIMPRLVASLLDAWDRRASNPAATGIDSRSAQPGPSPLADVSRRDSSQRRVRRRRGRR